MSDKLYQFADIPAVQSARWSTGIDELDWLYGGAGSDRYGVPEAALSLWGGASGVGKTKAVMKVVRNLLNEGRPVIYMALEFSAQRFREQYCGGIPTSAPLFVSESTNLGRISNLIREEKPALLVVDSVNMLDIYHEGRGAKAIERAVRSAISESGAATHVIFITHLNMEGTIKGGTSLPHMVDSVFYLKRFVTPKEMRGVAVGNRIFHMITDKHRFGLTGLSSDWHHVDSQNVVCDSNNRFRDEEWVIKNPDKELTKGPELPSEYHAEWDRLSVPVAQKMKFTDVLRVIFTGR